MTSSKGDLRNDPSLKKSVEGKVHSCGDEIDLTDSPVVEEPDVYPVSKGAIKKTTIVFVLFLSMSTFSAFLPEGIRKSLTRTS